MDSNSQHGNLVAIAFVRAEMSTILSRELELGGDREVQVMATIPNFNLDRAIDTINIYKPSVILVDAEVAGYSSAEVLTLKEKVDAPLVLVGLAQAGSPIMDEMRSGRFDLVYSLPLSAQGLANLCDAVPPKYKKLVANWGKGMFGVSAVQDIRDAASAAGGAGWNRSSICLFSPKGGVGKTFLAIEIAAMLAGIGGRKVALVDGNMNGGHVRYRLNIDATHSILNAADFYNRYKGHPSTEKDIPAQILNLMVPTPGLEHMHVLPGLMNQEQATNPSLAGENGELFAKFLVGMLKKDYDFVIIDTGSSTNVGMHRGFLRSVEEIFVIVTSETTSVIDAMSAVRNTMKGTFSLSSERMRLVINMWDERVGVSLKETADTVGLTGIGLIPLDSSNSPTLAGNDGQSFIALFANKKGNSPQVEKTMSGIAEISTQLYPAIIDAWNARVSNGRKKKKGFLNRSNE